MLRLFALLLVCLVLPVRALTLTPVAGELRHPWGLAFLPDGGYLVSERPGRLLRIDAGGNRHVVSGLPPLAATGQGVCSISPWTAMAGSISATASRGTEAPAPPWPGPDCKKRPSSTGNCCFAKSPRWPAAPISAPAWC